MAKRITTNGNRPSHEQIAERARAIYEASGCAPGRDLENWLAAETELISPQRAVAEPKDVYKPVARLKELPSPSARH